MKLLKYKHVIWYFRLGVRNIKTQKVTFKCVMHPFSDRKKEVIYENNWIKTIYNLNCFKTKIRNLRKIGGASK